MKGRQLAKNFIKVKFPLNNKQMTANINLQKLALVKGINIPSSVNESFKDQQADKFAGFLKNGKFSWIAVDGILRVLSTDTGTEIAYYNFSKHHSIEGCLINQVEEITYLPGICLLAVSIEFMNNSARAGMVCIFCVQGCKLLGSMDMSEKITCCKYISWESCRRSVLRQFHGTLAIGTDQGKLFLVDLMIPKDIKEITLSANCDSEIFPLINVPADLDQIQITHHHKKVVSSRESGEKCFFSIQVKEVLDETGSIISMLCMPNLYMLAVGLDDGRMVLYDLIELQAFHLAYPPGNRAPLTHMSYIEPADDPRSAVYVWTFHSSKDGAIAVMHSIMFDNKINGFYENFRSCSVRLTMPVFFKDTFPVCCRAITKSLTQDDEDVLTINLLAWTSPAKNRTHIMIFDLNQWYKEEMPSVGDWRNALNYTVIFEVQSLVLDVILDEKSLLPFKSLLRPEEHFYPTSLSFNVLLLESERFSHYRWNGIQNIVLQQFNTVGPQMILEPSFYFNELLQVAITPQFYDVNFNMATPLELKREFLLSVALEYNFTGFLKKCAYAWADGSYLGKDGSTGIGLSTLTEWIWNRVRTIKEICNTLCQPLFDYSEQRIDCGTQKQLSLCCRQLKILSDLLQVIAKDYQKFIPENVQSQIQTQANTVKMASDYQEVLQWLLNVGLLPEGHYNQNREEENDDFVIVPYPYRAIASHYETQRAKLSDDSNEDGKQSAKFLFIDAFIENECCHYDMLDWGCLYPPKSIQSLLRSLLVPDIPIENKYVIFIYLFMDITNALNDSIYSSIVRNLIKFPTVFRMNPSVIKRTQAFWNLDNGQLETSVEELISPLSHDRNLPQWQRELLIGALLKQNANSLALRALRCPGNSISSELEVAALLANNLISEALKVQRASGDRGLLEQLFHKILHSSSYEKLLDLALSNEEGQVLREYLQNTDLTNCVNLHFVYLLQRSKFIEAAQLMDSFSSTTNINLEAPKQVLNAYYSAMEPTTRKLTSMVYAENPVQVKEIPSPFSVNLIKSRCNASNDIYKKCVESITEATYDCLQDVKEMPFIGTPKLGIFEYKQQAHPVNEIALTNEFNDHGKRPQMDNNNGIFRLDDFEGPKMKRRRLEDVIVGSSASKKYTSYVDKRISLLTTFRQRRPKLNFTSRTPSASSRATPERVAIFGDLLTTPVIEKRTPVKIMPDRATTPASILKTRSCRSSVSPTHSRFSEFDDNKSVKSITFAALPGTNESSLNESSYLDESFGNQRVEDSSAEFYSPEKPDIIPIFSTSPKSSEKSDSDYIMPITSDTTIVSGPKARPPIKGTPEHPRKSPKKYNVIDNFPPIVVKAASQIKDQKQSIDDQEEVAIKPSEIAAQSTGIQDKVADTVVDSDLSFDTTSGSKYEQKSVLTSDFGMKIDNDSDSSSSDEDRPRKSVLTDSFGMRKQSSEEESSNPGDDINLLDSSPEEEDEIAEDEHFEEEELPEHSDYDEDDVESDGESFEYGDVDLNGSEESGSDEEDRLDENDVIEIGDSSDDEPVSSIRPTIDETRSTGPSNVDLGPTGSDILETQDLVSSDDQKDSTRLDTQNLGSIEGQKGLTNPELMITGEIKGFEGSKRSELIQTGSHTVNIEILSGFDQPVMSQNIEKQQVSTVKSSEPKNVQNIEPRTTKSTESVFLTSKSSEKTVLPAIIVSKSSETVNFSFITSKSTEPLKSHQTQPERSQQIFKSPLQPARKSPRPVSDDSSAKSPGKAATEPETVSNQEEIIPEDIESPPFERLSPAKSPQTHSFDDIELVADATSGRDNLDVARNEEFIGTESFDDIELVEDGQKVDAEPRISASKEDESADNRTNPSELMSEDCSFASAQNELNEAVLYTSSNTTLVADDERKLDENVTTETDFADTQDDKTNIMDKAMFAEESELENDQESSQQINEVTNPLKIAQLENLEATVTEQTEESSPAVNIEESQNILEVARIDETTRIADKSHDETDKEIQDILGVEQSVPVDLSTPKRQDKRLKRAVSVPSSGSSSPVSRSSRASSENRHNPKVFLKEKMLERIEESPSGSGILTRHKSKILLEQQSRETTPVSQVPSEEIDSSRKTPRRRSSTATPTTPRRIFTRASSKDSTEKTPEEQSDTRKTRKKTVAASDDEHDDAKSTRSTRSTSSKKKGRPASAVTPVPQSTSPIDEISVSNRRLTRSQLSVIEKSRQLTEKMTNEVLRSPARLRATKSDVGHRNEQESDNESVKSDSTTSRSSRKRKIPKFLATQDSETSSIASKTSRKSKSPQKKHLSVIHEEGDSEVSEMSSTGRRRKARK